MLSVLYKKYEHKEMCNREGMMIGSGSTAQWIVNKLSGCVEKIGDFFKKEQGAQVKSSEKEMRDTKM
jgi:hypothetical protein